MLQLAILYWWSNKAPAYGGHKSTIRQLNLCQVAGAQKVVLSTYLDRAGEVVQGVLPLRRDEGVILEPA